ncbi:MAG: rod shape-determining protein MreC [Chloroflexota bacterium]|nr:rod shape-determining protein MreC [Chloroflexota bacterium]
MFGRSPHRRTNAGLWFAVFTIFSLVMLLASRTEQAAALQQVTARAFDPVRGAIAGIGDGAAGLAGAIGEIDRLRSENDRLHDQLAGAERRVAELTEAAHENAQLRDLLKISKALDMKVLPARITGRDPSNFAWEVGIDAGTRDGVGVGMPVVASASGTGALAGTIVQASDASALVRFIVDTRSSVIAVDQQTRALGEITGQLGGQLLFVKVPVTERLAEGDTVVSAGLSVAPDARSAYPKGLLIGRIGAVETDANALTQTGFVRPAVDPRAIERVLVVLEFTQG